MAQEAKSGYAKTSAAGAKVNWRKIRLFLIIFFIWLGISCLLLLGVRNAPVREADPDAKPFQIIPQSED